MYFLEQLRPFTAPNILGGHSYPVPTYRWKQIAASEDKRALEKILNSTIKRRAKREGKNEYDIGREYKIVSNNPNDINDRTGGNHDRTDRIQGLYNKAEHVYISG